MEPMHSLGGSALDRLVYEFEATGDAGEGAGAGAGASGDAGAAPSPAPAGGSESSADATDAAPAWSPEQITALRDNADFRSFIADEAAQLTDARLAPVLGLLQQLAGANDAAAGNGVAPGPLDPWADDFGTSLDQRFQALEQRLGQMLEQVAQPLQAREEAETVAQGNQRIESLIADDLTRNGAVGEKAQSLIRPLAEAMFPDLAARFGSGPRAAELAVQQAVRTVRDIVGEARVAGGTETTEHLNSLAGARTELAGNSGGAQGLSESQDPREITRRFAGRIRAANGI